MSTSQGWLLGIHTTTPALGLALMAVEDPLNTLRSQSWLLDRALASQLHVCLQAFLPPQTWSDLKAIGVAVGPGSFTGSRLGVTVARTLGQALDLPVYGISTLAAIAQTYIMQQHLDRSDRPTDVWVEMDGQRGEWLAGQYRYDPATQCLLTLSPDRLWSAAEWQQIKTGSASVWISEANYRHPPATAALLQLAAQRLQQPSPWYSVEPVYSRQPPIHNSADPPVPHLHL